MTGVGTGWRRSSRCDTGGCVWMRVAGATVEVRDEHGATLAVPRSAWAGLVRHVRETA